MTAEKMDQLIRQLGALRDRTQQIEEFDLPSAHNKGYSGAGQTVAELREELADNEAEIKKLEQALATIEFD